MHVTSHPQNSHIPEINSHLEKLRFPSQLPPSFSRESFFDLLRTSLALTLNEKLRILLELPALSEQQVLDLYKTFQREQTEFASALLGCSEEDLKQLTHRTNQAEKDWLEVVRRWNKLVERPPKAPFDSHDLLTPEALHILLDAHVVGQTHVTGELAMLVYHQMLACHVAMESNTAIPGFSNTVLLAGLTGTGKTFTIQKICELADLVFVHVNTASLVSEGIVGTSVNDIGREILRKADNDVRRAEHAIVFLDEFDKTMSGAVYGSSVVHQLLRVIEGAEFNIIAIPGENADTKPKVSALNTGSMLFILGGAFQNLLESKHQTSIGFGKPSPNAKPKFSLKDLVRLGFPKELAGRINTILTLNPLSKDDYYAILTQSSSSPLNEFLKLIRSYGDDVHIPEEALQEMAGVAAEAGLGARALQKIVYGVFKDILYEAPNPVVQTFVVNREKVLDVVEGVNE